MNIDFKDMYGQSININDNTASGNVRIKVTTSENLNDLHKPDSPKIETDISLDDEALEILIATLTYIKQRKEGERSS